MRRRELHPTPLARALRWARSSSARIPFAIAALAVIACSDTREATVAESEQSAQPADMAYATGGGIAASSGLARGVPAPGRPGSRTEGEAETPPPPPMPTSPTQAPGPTSTTPAEPGASIVPPMLIRTGNAVIEVDSLEIAISEVRLLAQRMGGFIANTSMQTGQGQIRAATLEMKVPSARFDEAIGGLRPLGKVEAVNEQSEDVGEEFVDITARMTNARRLEERLLALLANRTGKLEDVLAVERELARVRQEIERYEGRMRYLRTRAAVSTLSVTVHEPRPLIGSNPGRSVIGEAFRNAWRNFVRFIAGLIEAMGVLVPLAVIGVVAWLLWRRFGPRFPIRRPPEAP